jgi:signal transduction histidine kinase
MVSVKVPLENKAKLRLVVGRRQVCRPHAKRQSAIDELHQTELSQRVFAAQEKERQRLAAELHDRIGSTLAAVAMDLAMIAGHSPANTRETLAARLGDARALIAQSISAIRDICDHLRPATLEYSGLYGALREHAKQFSRRFGIAVHVDGSDFGRQRSPERELSLLRIAQEALANCAKHAHATTINVELADADDELILSISDDGIGFDLGALHDAVSAPGLGLLTMRERAESAGGTFAIDSTRGKGTRIRVKM